MTGPVTGMPCDSRQRNRIGAHVRACLTFYIKRDLGKQAALIAFEVRASAAANQDAMFRSSPGNAAQLLFDDYGHDHEQEHEEKSL